MFFSFIFKKLEGGLTEIAVVKKLRSLRNSFPTADKVRRSDIDVKPVGRPPSFCDGVPRRRPVWACIHTAGMTAVSAPTRMACLIPSALMSVAESPLKGEQDFE